MYNNCYSNNVYRTTGNKAVAYFKIQLIQLETGQNNTTPVQVASRIVRVQCEKSVLFTELRDKLRQKFVQLRDPNTAIHIFWQDVGEELLDILDQEDLLISMERMTGSIKNIIVVFETQKEDGKNPTSSK